MNVPMNMSNIRDDLHLLAGAYALGSLDDLETRRFKGHLSGCESCRVEVASFETAVEHLAREVAEPAPTELRRKVMDVVDQTRQVSPLVDSSRRGMRPAASLVAAAACILAVVTSGLLVRANNESNALREIAAVYEAPDAVNATLPLVDGEVRVTFSEAANVGVIRSADLAALTDQEIYQLWIINDSGITAETVFAAGEVDESLRFDFNADLAAGDVLAITIEPAGGSAQPTTAPIAASEPILS